MRHLFQILILWSGSVFAQTEIVDCKNEFAFLRHTIEAGLLSESATQFDRLTLIPCQNSNLKDSLAFKLGLLCMNNGFECKEFMRSINNSSSELHFRANLAMQFQRIEYQQYSTDPVDFQFQNEFGSQLSLVLSEAERILSKPLMIGDRTTDNSYCLRLYKSQDQYVMIKRKSSVIAGALSMVVPGLGKLYAKEPGQFMLTLLPNLMFAGQATEAYFRGGIKDPRFIFFSAVTGIFYVGNIYSSVKSVQRIKQKAYENLHRSILDIVRQPTIKYLRSEF